MTVSHSLLTGVLDQPTLSALFERAKAVRWALAPRAFAETLSHSVACRFGASGANVGEIEAYVETLHLEDLALACACAEGQLTAWAYFLECFRPAVGNAGRAIAGEATGDQLAHSLYAELYGRDEHGRHRRSLLDRYVGRSRLATWLRAVLAQRYVDREAPFDALLSEERRRLLEVGGQDAGPTTGNRCPDLELLAAWFDQSLASLETSIEARVQGETGALKSHLARCARCKALEAALARSQPQVLYVHPRSPRTPWWRHVGDMLRSRFAPRA